MEHLYESRISRDQCLVLPEVDERLLPPNGHLAPASPSTRGTLHSAAGKEHSVGNFFDSVEIRMGNERMGAHD
jgi:hypothetical protein